MYRQPTLFGDAPPAVDTEFAGLTRHDLDGSTWIDHTPGWLDGADTVFDQLVDRLDWRQREVAMYGRLLPEPRLSSWWSARHGGIPLPVLDDIRHALDRRYGVWFSSIGFNWYRTGDDSVAWHADTRGPPVPNPTIAIVSVGTPRPFRLRPRGGGRSHTFELGAGDLLVMGGACQHDWEHAVPKSRHCRGPRISITYRHDGNH
ncbi:alpha-ketoglutarate-dependent dioxygenase AlkB [Desertimonas flava]|uniref:alpha-ketoglutarate-dependent dioxygenase AlkB n=1 Tax=Desertimonas flava TaxID=2064846 RepID=UPI001969439E|nr:alpha-ketoglutarate-dependent dioxygenase AlkB [Desertimonas flava]